LSPNLTLSLLLVILCLLLSTANILALKSLPFLLLCLGLHTLRIVCLLGRSQGPDTVLTYFLPAVVGTLLWFIGSQPLLSGSGVCLCGLLLKLGSFPFHFWGLKLVRNLPPSTLFLVMGPAKLPIVYLLVFSLSPFTLLRYILILVGSVGFLTSSSVAHLLVWSSHLTLGLFFFIAGYVFLLYLFVYNFCILLLLYGRLLSARAPFACLTLAGLPPFYLFWVKILFLYSLPLYLCLLVLLAFAASAFGWVCHGTTSFFLLRGVHTSLGLHLLLTTFLAQLVCSLVYL